MYTCHCNALIPTPDLLDRHLLIYKFTDSYYAWLFCQFPNVLFINIFVLVFVFPHVPSYLVPSCLVFVHYTAFRTQSFAFLYILPIQRLPFAFGSIYHLIYWNLTNNCMYFQLVNCDLWINFDEMKWKWKNLYHS